MLLQAGNIRRVDIKIETFLLIEPSPLKTLLDFLYL
jgi:hypothetical protein